MIEVSGKRGMALCILKVLETHSSEKNPLTSTDIIKYLEADYGVHAVRNTVSENISFLCELGYDISTYEDNGKGTFIRVNRDFSDEEIRVLVDSVLTSRYIPEKKAEALIKRLLAHTDKKFVIGIKHIHPVNEWNHQRNEEFFNNLSVLAEAINEKKQAEFYYNEMKTDGTLSPKSNRIARVHPYEIACSNEQYYLICSLGHYDNLLHYRIDRMTSVAKREKNARNITTMPGYSRGINLGEYAAKHSFMHGGNVVPVILKMPVERAGDVQDAFGTRALMKDLGNGYMEVHVMGALEGMEYFALQFGKHCEVLKPQELRDRIVEDLKLIKSNYGVL